jgi:hypothetical protein
MIKAAAALWTLLKQRKGSLLLIYGVVPFLVGFWIIAGVFNTRGVFPLDSGDEPAETYIQVPMALSYLFHGGILKINVFNNFGTPILGEPVVYPYALHAWTYLLFRPMLAMLLNKFLLAALTMVVLTAFFRRFFSPLVSSLCAFLAFSGPQFFYFFQNHPHQGALFYFGLVLLAVRRFMDQPGAGRAWWVYAAGLVFLFSVGVNGTLLGSVFIVGYAVLLAGRRWKLSGWTLVLLGTAFVAVYPHFHEFFRLAAASARKDLNYQELLSTPPLLFLKQLLLPNRKASATAISYTWPIVLLLLAGLAFVLAALYRGRIPAPAKLPPASQPGAAAAARRFNEFWRLNLLLGMAPCLGIILLRLLPALVERLPLVRATNITRVLWFSDVFLMLSAGFAVQRVAQILSRYGRPGRVLGLLALAAALVPRCLAFNGQSNTFYLNEAVARFQPEEFLPLMRPYTRLAAFTDPVPLSADTKANAHRMLGSAGRSIILNKAFRDYLERADAIRLGYYGMTYFFQPAAPETLAHFGIRYGLAYFHKMDGDVNTQLTQLGWTRLGTRRFQSGPDRFAIALYESPLNVTPFYSIQDTNASFLQRYIIHGNDLLVQVPASDSPSLVVATFVALPGWKAFLDGVPVPIERGEDQFIQVVVPPGAAPPAPDAPPDGSRVLALKYEPYTDACLLGLLALSLLAGGGLSWLAGRLRLTGLATR